MIIGEEPTVTDTPPPFAVTVEAHNGREVVRVVGELDLATVGELEAATEPLVTEGRTVFFDLRGLTFVDSTGLKYFVGLYHAAQRDGFAFTMTHPPHAAFRAFEMTTLDTVLPWTDDPAG